MLPLLAAIIGGGSPQAVYAATTITVTTTNDEAVTDGKCSLREAIANANAHADTTAGDCVAGSPGGDTIDLSGLSGAITLGSSLPAISDDVTIKGPGASALTINANGHEQVFTVGAVTVSIAGLTMTGAAINDGILSSGTAILSSGALTVDNSTITGNSGRFGGGIASLGSSLTVQNSTISGNNAGNSGGGILNQGSTATILNSTISGNHAVADFGGGIVNFAGALTVQSSTISGNSDGSQGGGIFNATSATLTVTNSTISGNSATFGGGIENAFGTLTVVSSTISANSAAASAGGGIDSTSSTLENTIVAGQSAGANCSRPVLGDGGYNIEDGGSCGFSTANHSLPNTNPLLDPAGLKNNGGPTQTIALVPGSPAIDAIPPGVNGCGTTITTDQRGVSRPQGSGCDIGAFELMTSTLRGTLADGADYLIEVPPHWNGTLVLYSHGYVPPGSANPAQDVGDPITGAWLLGNGYALAGTNYGLVTGTGWAVQNALKDQADLVDFFSATIGRPTRVIAWGHSLGGIITAGLIQTYPGRFAGALPMCGVLAGGVGIWNEALDGAFAFKTLVAPVLGPNAANLRVVNITNPGANLSLAEQALAAAQSSPQGRARLALVAALGDLPGWFNPLSAEPNEDNVAAQEANQFLWEQQVDFPFLFALRAELEARAGGNPSWNTQVDYRKQLAESIDREEVKDLYRTAGLSLEADLAALNHANRIAADPAAVAYLSHNIIFNGDINIPVLTMHTTGDGLVPNQDEQAYASVVRSAGDAQLLRQIFVHRAGHCTFTPAETITAFQTLIHRLNTGSWGESIDPTRLNQEANGLGASYNVFGSSPTTLVPVPPAFLRYHPTKFLRPFDARVAGGDDEGEQELNTN